MQLHGRGSRLLHLQAPQGPRRADMQDSSSSSRCQQYSSGTRPSGVPGAAAWSSVKAHDTFSEDTRYAGQRCPACTTLPLSALSHAESHILSQRCLSQAASTVL